jgi:D-threo-aldose 1-dehydrogenase
MDGTHSGSLGPSPLQPRDLGTTGLRVGALCVGCAPLGDMPEAFTYSVGEELACETIRTVLDSRITFLDTAASYGDGESERRIGLVLRERGGMPDGVVLATKADRDLRTGDFSGDQIRRSVERSVRLLGLDRLQLVYLHDPELSSFEAIMAPGGPVDVLRRFREEGVIEHIGVAGGPIGLMTRYVATGEFEVAISHNRFTLLNIAASPFWDACNRHGVAAVNAAPYGGGMLAQGPDVYARYAYEDADPEVLRRARTIHSICARHGVPLAAAALQFSLRDPRVTSTIVGIGAPHLVAQTIDLALRPIPEELWEDLTAVPPSTLDPAYGHFT